MSYDDPVARAKRKALTPQDIKTMPREQLNELMYAADSYIYFLVDMLRVFTTSLHTVNPQAHLNGGARMMLAAMGRATLSKEWKP